MNNLLEKLFDKLDYYLHKGRTYLDLEDEVFTLQFNYDAALETIEFYREREEEKLG